jgi:NAD-dependent oxidoreductase involved in siderophore biosynthesis
LLPLSDPDHVVHTRHGLAVMAGQGFSQHSRLSPHGDLIFSAPLLHAPAAGSAVGPSSVP